jgi:hypothetical protein
MTMHDIYETPEGYVLARPLTMPDARSFAEVLTYHSEWDHEFMNGRSRQLVRPSGSRRADAALRAG